MASNSRYIGAMRLLLALAAAAGVALAAACARDQGDSKTPVSPPSALLTQARGVFSDLPDTMPGAESDTPAMVALGKKLYNDTGLSVNRSQSCNTCHQIDNGRPGTDSDATSFGALGKRGTRNSNTVLNAGFQFVQFWDGRAKDLEEQAKGPILNPVEMAMPDAKAVEARLITLGYRDQFARAFPRQAKPVTFDNWAKAVAAFERTLVSRTGFHDFVAGDESALTDSQKAGLQTFMEKGCTVCHAGSMLGGQMYQKMGLLHPYPDREDTGRHTVTKNPSDRMMFKVPILTNVALTAPYFHDGKSPTIADAVKQMAWLQFGTKLTPEETRATVDFLKSLNGKGVTTRPVSSR